MLLNLAPRITLPTRDAGVLVALAGAAVVVGAIAAVEPIAAVALIVAVVSVLWVSVRPFALLVAFMIVLMTRPTDFIPALAVAQPAKVLALGAIGAFLLSRLGPRTVLLPRTPLAKWMIALSLILVASSALGTNPGESFALLTDVFVKILILQFLILNLVSGPVQALRFQQALLATCAGLAGYALWAQAAGLATVEGSRAALVGLLGDPNDLALVLLMPVGFALSATVQARGFARALYGLGALLVVGGIAATQSRGGLLALGAAGVLTMWPHVRRKALFLAVLGVGFVGLVAASGLSSRSSGGASGDGLDESAQGRLDAWAAAGRMVMRYPVFGVGPGRFRDNYLRFAHNPVIWKPLETHNTYLKAVAETGLSGAVVFLAAVGVSLRAAFRSRTRALNWPAGAHRAAADGLAGSLSGVLIAAFFLSQTWSWFIYILLAQAAAWDRTYGRPLDGSEDAT
jgi:putative inorganic carbon (hco3(-)) transporter